MKNQMQGAVFQPDYNLPTMSLEEFAENEVREAMEREANQAEAEQARAGEDSEEEEVIDRERKKASEWDDWKDQNPKGWGNTKRM
jgi:hypothetical protein